MPVMKIKTEYRKTDRTMGIDKLYFLPILEGDIVYLSQPCGQSFCIQFLFAQFADQILQDLVPLKCPLALSEVKSFQ